MSYKEGLVFKTNPHSLFMIVKTYNHKFAVLNLSNHTLEKKRYDSIQEIIHNAKQMSLHFDDFNFSILERCDPNEK